MAIGFAYYKKTLLDLYCLLFPVTPHCIQAALQRLSRKQAACLLMENKERPIKRQKQGKMCTAQALHPLVRRCGKVE